VPLDAMKEQGAYINATGQWRNPEGKFDWNSKMELVFCADDITLDGYSFWFNDIQIVK